WDVFFTTKTYNVPELLARGVKRPILVGKSYDPETHRPLSASEVGEEFERFDAVFVGSYERPRLQSLNMLAAAGVKLVVYGDFPGGKLDPRITSRPPEYAVKYTMALHTGKVALCFLRKLNRDRVTQRSVEIPASERPMVGERTDEHDAMFLPGKEY